MEEAPRLLASHSLYHAGHGGLCACLHEERKALPGYLASKQEASAADYFWTRRTTSQREASVASGSDSW